jgi:hypothetical protein
MSRAGDGRPLRTMILQRIEQEGWSILSVARRIEEAGGPHRQTVLSYLYSGRNARVETVEWIMWKIGLRVVSPLSSRPVNVRPKRGKNTKT